MGGVQRTGNLNKSLGEEGISKSGKLGLFRTSIKINKVHPQMARTIPVVCSVLKCDVCASLVVWYQQ